MAEGNLGQSGAAGGAEDQAAGQVSGQNSAQQTGVPFKKPKTEAQKLREKERRRRRRQKKRAEENGNISKDNAGKDVSFLNPKTESTEMEVAADLSLNKIKDPEGEEFSGLEMPKMIGRAQEGEDLTEQEAAEYEHMDVPPPLPPIEDAEQTGVEEEAVADQQPEVKEVFFQPQDENKIDEVPADEAEIVEQPIPEVIMEEPEDIRRLEVPPSVQAFEEVQNSEEMQPEEDLDEQERLRENENQQKVSELNQHLDSLEEMPVKQGLLGKLFDWFSGRFAKKEEVSSEIEVLPSSQQDTDFGGELVKKIIGVIVLIALVIAAFWLGSSFKLVDRIMNFFQPGDVRLVLQEADPNLQVVDLELLRGYGFRTAEILGENAGDSADTVYPSFKVAYYFGKLSEPIFVGETGITAALYYGFREEEQFLKNRFILYITELEKLYNTNTVDIDVYLSQSVRRDLALDEYIDDLQTAFDEGNNLRKEIALQVDELKISLNSTAADKNRFETDFFVSLQTYQAEKADQLLAAFIEVTQKETEFKAKLAALTSLYESYETVLLSMKVRIEAIKLNKGALVTGVKVRDIPNSGLDLVIE